MSSPPQGRPNVFGQQAFEGIFERLIETRANARRQLLAELRRNAGANPLFGAGLGLAEQMSVRCEDMERSLIRQMASSATPTNGTRERRPPPACDVPPRESRGQVARAEQSERQPPALRVAVPEGVASAVIPLQIRNHRDFVDTVVLSAVPAAHIGAAILPVELLRFEPSALRIAPNTEECAHLHLRLSPDLHPEAEYWSRIVISGTDVKHIPLAVRVVRQSASAPQQPAS